MHGSDQQVACKGCSCRKYLLPSNCSRYKLHTNSMCFLARASALSKAVVSSARARFRAIHVLKALQAGDPIRRYGFCSLRRASAFLRLPDRLTSHGIPSDGSFTMRSKAKPAAMGFHLRWATSFVILGCEYISETRIRLTACCLSRT